jgi:hypothetical protein
MNPLHWIVQFTFGCRHRHLSRVFTIKRRTYRVCFDCGGEFDLPGVGGSGRPTVSGDTGLLTSPIADPKDPRFDSANHPLRP